MSGLLYLDEKQVYPLQPSEGEVGNRTRISPFAIPSTVTTKFSHSSAAIEIVFDYAGNQVGDYQERLDNRDDPAVDVCISSRTSTVMSLSLDPPADSDAIIRVAARMQERAPSIDKVAKRFSYQMVAGILNAFAGRIATKAGD